MHRLLSSILFICTVAVSLSFVSLADAKYEYGNIIMSRSEDKMKKDKVDLVVFPHWIHSMWFKCKVCHEKPFLMKKDGNDITMKKIDEGEECGICHNGTVAFAQKECKRCHSLSEEAAMTLKTDDLTKKLYPGIFTKKLTKGDDTNKDLKFADPKTISIEDYKQIADRLKATWKPEIIQEKGGLPYDKMGLIDWEKVLFKDKLISPVSASNGNLTAEEKTRDNSIVFEVLSDFVDSVVFRHKEHSYLLNCDTCHEKIFTSVLGENEVHMRRNSDGEFCGYCHGKVSFPLAQCIRCHTLPKGEKLKNQAGEVLVRINPLKDKKLVVGKGGLKIAGEKTAEEIKQDAASAKTTQEKVKADKDVSASIISNLITESTPVMIDPKKDTKVVNNLSVDKKEEPTPLKEEAPVTEKAAEEKKIEPLIKAEAVKNTDTDEHKGHHHPPVVEEKKGKEIHMEDMDEKKEDKVTEPEKKGCLFFF